MSNRGDLGPGDGALAGRHVLVTGASRGLGRGCAERAASLGAELTLCARGEAELEEVRAAIEASGGSAQVAPLDATDPGKVAEAVAAADAHAPLWGCVQAVGGNRTGASIDYPVEDLDRLLALNVRSTFCVLREVARGMVLRGDGGRLVAISSQMGSVGYPGRAAYCAAKHAVHGLVRALGVEWAPRGVTVNAVAPTFVETDLTREMLADQEFRAEIVSRIPLGRLGEVDEVAATAVFLLGPEAGLTTGSVIPVDGGWTAA
jgi:NAD(P)-dependent dehydrogenase (short-subunit alcohol dehydrogenase family)